MKKSAVCIVIGLLVLGMHGNALAHFGMVIPSDTMVMPGDNRLVKVILSFSHPFERQGMELVRPAEFGVMTRGEKQSLLDSLTEARVMGHKAWTVGYRITRPGVYTFYMQPAPYWEPAEDCYIVHYTKTIISAFGDEEGWDEPVGLKAEIIPLTRPFGLYAGNVFQGIVKVDGKSFPWAEVEIEYYNQDGRSEAPTDYMVTQTIKADQNGVFTYAAPKAGWWGFAALTTSDKKMKYKGQDKDVEIGAILWVEFHNWKER